MGINCKTPEELAAAINRNEEYIFIEGDFKNKVIRIKAVGKVSWGVCVAALAIAVIAILASGKTSDGATAASGFVATTVVTATLGTAVVPAIAIGVAAGGIGALNTLRDKYKIVESTDTYIKLKRN